MRIIGIFSSFGASNMKKFSGATAISSAQYYGEKEEEPDQGIDYYQGKIF